MIAEMAYYDNGNYGAGYKSILSAAELGEAYMNGENIRFHLPASEHYRESYLDVVLYEPAHTSGSDSYPENFVVGSAQNLMFYDNWSNFTSFNGTKIDDGKVCITIYID